MKYEYNEELFNGDQTLGIKKAIRLNMDKNIFKLMTQIDKEKNPVFNYFQMIDIIEGYRSGLTEEQIKLFTQLDDNITPIFNTYQMSEIRFCFEIGLTTEYISNTLARIENGVAIFDYKEMYDIKNFLESANDKQRQQFKEIIDDKIPFYFFCKFMDTGIPAENMRIYRTLYDFKCTSDTVEQIVSEEPSYDELKEIKYLLSCAKELEIDVESLLNESGLECSSIKSDLSHNLYMRNCAMSAKAKDIINKCLDFKMEPKQIAYLTNPDNCFNTEEIEAIAIGLLNNLTIEEITYIVFNTESNDPEQLKENINKAIVNKLAINPDFNEEVIFKTNWFEEVVK